MEGPDTIHIVVGSTTQEASGWNIGPFHVRFDAHPERDAWVITHRQTGMGFPFGFADREDCFACAKALEAVDVPWADLTGFNLKSARQVVYECRDRFEGFMFGDRVSMDVINAAQLVATSSPDKLTVETVKTEAVQA